MIPGGGLSKEDHSEPNRHEWELLISKSRMPFRAVRVLFAPLLVRNYDSFIDAFCPSTSSVVNGEAKKMPSETPSPPIRLTVCWRVVWCAVSSMRSFKNLSFQVLVDPGARTLEVNGSFLARRNPDSVTALCLPVKQ